MLPSYGLYAITDGELLPGAELYTGVEAALRGGADMVQYRDKTASADERKRRGRELLSLCRDYQRPLIINDDLALAMELNASGVHLGQDDGDLRIARRALGPGKILGATCHGSLELGRAAASAGCDYLAFGRFFSSRTKDHAPPATLDVLAAAHKLGLPVVAIGGITLDNAGQALASGADFLAVVNGLFGADDIQTRARQFTQLIHTARREIGGKGA